MSKARRLAIFALLLTSHAFASGSCPITLVSGAGGPKTFSVTFRNGGKLPIRRLEFNCTPLHARPHKAQSASCSEENALFFPGTEYTVSYSYPDGVARPLLVSLKSATSADGYVWKPSKRQPCRSLNINPRSGRK